MSSIRLLAAAVFAVSFQPAYAQEKQGWVIIDDPAELRALMSDKTFRGVSAEGVPFVNHYRADGTGVLLYKGQRFPRTWKIEAGTVCVTEPRETNCYRMQRNLANPRQFVSQHAQRGWTNAFTVEDGVPPR